MLITELTPVGKTRTRVQIDYDRTLVLSNRELMQYGISADRELSDENYQEMLQNLYHQAIRKCGELLKGMDYTEKGLKDKLIQKGFPEETADAAVDAMKEAHYIDDRRYAESYIRSRAEGKSSLRIRMDLKAKGVSESLIRETFDTWEEQNGDLLEEKERDQIRELLRKKRYHPQETDRQQGQKIMAFLMRKGYSAELIREVMRSEDYAEDF